MKKILIAAILIISLANCRETVNKQQEVVLVAPTEIVCNYQGKYAARKGDLYLGRICYGSTLYITDSGTSREIYSYGDTGYFKIGHEIQFDSRELAKKASDRYEDVMRVQVLRAVAYHRRKEIEDSLEKLSHQYRICK